MAKQPPKEPDFGPASDSLYGEELTVVPPRADIVFHDDDATPVDFVLFLLQNYVGFDVEQAEAMVKDLATEGHLRVVTLPRPLAEALMHRIQRAIEKSGYPFQATLADHVEGN